MVQVPIASSLALVQVLLWTSKARKDELLQTI